MSFRWRRAAESGPSDTPALCAEVAGMLTSARLLPDPAENRDDFLWQIWVPRDGAHVEMLLGYAGDEAREWLITSYARPGWPSVFSRRRRALAEALLADCMRALHRGLIADDRFFEIRWYEQEKFDRDHGDTWSETPE